MARPRGYTRGLPTSIPSAAGDRSAILECGVSRQSDPAVIIRAGPKRHLEDAERLVLDREQVGRTGLLAERVQRPAAGPDGELPDSVRVANAVGRLRCPAVIDVVVAVELDVHAHR